MSDDEAKQWMQSYMGSLEEELKELQHKVKKQKETIDQLLDDIQNLNDELKQKQENCERISFYNKENNEYFPFVHKCVWNLIGKHVSYTNVPHVIQIILEMLNLKYDRLPSESTIRNMKNECTLVSQIHIADISTKQNTTLGTDETPQNSDIYMTYTVMDNDGEAH